MGGGGGGGSGGDGDQPHRHTSFPPREVTQPSRLFHDGKFGANLHRMDGLKFLDCFPFSLNTLPFRKDYPPTGECGKSGGARQVGKYQPWLLRFKSQGSKATPPPRACVQVHIPQPLQIEC